MNYSANLGGAINEGDTDAGAQQHPQDNLTPPADQKAPGTHVFYFSM
jgi:hypothetical protein